MKRRRKGKRCLLGLRRGGRSCSGEEETGESGEPAVREEAEAVWDRRGTTAEEGSAQFIIGSEMLHLYLAASSLFKMLLKYRPEDKAAKKERLVKRAQAEAEGKTSETKKPIVVKYGLNHVTYLIEQKKAQLVVIAHDVDPIELVVWLPALCRKLEIPYCIVKGKARLGTIVHKKTASVLCLTTVKNEDKMEFSKILEAIKANFNDKYDEYRKKWGGGIMGSKSQAKTKAKERLLAKEAAQRMT
ncbi:hypothetical protein RJ639_028844 [Escallonia herrerae]|uniref:60S ribosomal protein L7a n=1 Tax=Escallonia herrerae TaxID=1293975 RepID=A0AA88X942_9ASTE|nr:hypothetical protein RJ639_028844 [Escallonia herrerae]